MKTIIYVNLLLLLCSCSDSKTKEVLLPNQSIPKVYVLKSSSNISFKSDTILLNHNKYSGYLYELNPVNRDTILLEAYSGGLQNGVSKKWYATKKIMEQRNYLNGRKIGKQIAYWENGNKKFEFIAKDDAYEGEMKEWNIEGKLIHLANFKNGQENGTQKMWYDNGKIRANYVIIDGKRYGLLGTKNCRNVSDSIFVVK
ncbi:toxin-antitoxin system YwqK family antitoxin [Polaribacter sp.]|jgi:antitoxin component YwqK of YwqJK toxin-antitoxin module|uniref:toxin-antitoxin system YwqK family antitoxin n=1 Tax=Polaribacter sp. TaxID=1920175 RepID=UPI0040472824